MHPFARAALIALLSLAPLSALAQVSTTQSLTPSTTGAILFYDWPQDFISNRNFFGAFANDVAPYASQISSYATPLPNTLWTWSGSGGNLEHYDFLYDGGADNGATANANPRTDLSHSTLNRVCSLIDPTAVSPTSGTYAPGYSGSWQGSASNADANRVFVYSPTTITWSGGNTPAGWSDKSQQYTGCPNGDYYCHYGVERFACTTYALPGQGLSASSYNISAGQPVTLSWTTAYRDTALGYISSHDYVSPTRCLVTPPPPTSCSSTGFTLSGRNVVVYNGGEYDSELRRCINQNSYSAFVVNSTGSVTVSPTTTTTYSFTCTNANGSRTVSATVNVAAPTAACSLPWGGSIPSGSSVTAYQSSSATYPSSCASQTRTCNNGSLSGSYANKSCSVNYPAPTAYPTISPDPTPSGTAPAVTLHSTNANYCYVAVDWNVIAAGYFNSGTYNGPSNLPSGTHQAETYCYNVVWQGSGWSGTNFTVSPQPPNPVGGSVTPTSATAGTPVSFVGTITNTGTGSTVTSFPNWLVVRNGPNGNGSDVFDNNVSAPALAAGASESISDPPWTPSASGVYSIIVCAGYDTTWNRVPSNSSGGGCGPWTNIKVVNPTCANGAINPTACTQCPNNLAYVGGSCVACDNGGCTGSGGSASSPTGGLACNNGATNPASCNAFPPACSTLSATPTDINAGDKVSLTWACSGAASCTQIANSDGFSTSNKLSGTDPSVKPSAASGQVTYGLSCGGTNFYFPPVTVHSPKATLSASATRVPSGSTVTLHGVGTDVKSCSIVNSTLGSTVIADSKAASGSWDKTSAAQIISSQTVYTLSCKTNGASVTSSLIVNVLPGFKEF